jgi:hypothetical protein
MDHATKVDISNGKEPGRQIAAVSSRGESGAVLRGSVQYVVVS